MNTWQELEATDAALLGAHGGEPVVAVRPSLVRALHGNGNAAIMLSQLLYWSARTDDPDGWFYNKQSAIEEQTGLGSDAQLKARKFLKSLGLIEDKLKGVPPTVFYRVNLALVAQIIRENTVIPISAQSRKLKSDLSRNTISAQSRKLNSDLGRKSYKDTEITTEITQESTTERDARAKPQNSTSTLRIETPPATVHSSAPRAAPLVDMSDPNDPRFTTPFYPAVANACGIRPEPMKTSLPMRSRIANAAAKFERDGYTVEQIAVMRENWTMPNPPSPDQLYDRADSLLTARKTNGTHGNHNDISQRGNERAGERLSERERRFQERQDIRREYLERFGTQVAGGAR